MENNAKKAKEKLDKELGITEKDLLLDLIGEIRLLKKDLPQLDKLQEELEQGNEISVKHFKRLLEVAKQLKVELPDKFKVEVVNQQEYPDKVKVSNLDEIVVPKQVEIKEAGWLVKWLLKLTNEVEDLIKRTFKVSLDNHTLPPDKAIPVRLVTRGGRYYTARSGGTSTVSGAARQVKLWDGQDYVDVVNDTLSVTVFERIADTVDLRATIKGGDLELSGTLTVGSYDVEVVDGTGVTADDMLNIRQNNHFYQSEVQSVAGNVITVSTPIDFAYTTDAEVDYGVHNLAVDGSTTNQVASIRPSGTAEWEMYGLSIHITDGVDMDDGLFGGITALSNGVLFRRFGDYYKNFYNIKENGDFSLFGFDKQYDDKAPSGVYGLTAQKTSEITNGVAVELIGAEDNEFQIVIQDDLTGLNSFEIVAHGHAYAGK